MARANACRHRCWHGATGIRFSTHPCAYCLLGFESLKKFEFRNREGADFSFGEYRSYFGGQGAVDDDFDGFVRRGGLAGSYDYDDVSESYGYIRDVYKTILTRDLVQKSSLPDSAVLERLAEYVMDNSGNLNSPNNIADVLDANRVPTNHVTVGRHLSHLRDAFVFYEARRYDIKGRRCLSAQAKHYVCDSGVRYAVLGARDMDWGRTYENAAFLELMRRGCETYVGKLRQKEADFVAKRGSGLVYIQAGDDVSADSTLERELAPLLSIRDAFPKALIARTRHEPYTRGACSCWTSRGGCSASRGSKRRGGVSLDGARSAARARMGDAVSYRRPKAADWHYCQTSMSSSRKAIVSIAKPQLAHHLMGKPPEV